MSAVTSNLIELLNNIPSKLLTALIVAIISVPLTLYTQHRIQIQKLRLNNDSVTLRKLLTLLPESFMVGYLTKQDFGLLIDGDDTSKILDSVQVLNTLEYTFLDCWLKNLHRKFLRKLKIFVKYINVHYGYEEERNIYRLPYPDIIGQEEYDLLQEQAKTHASAVHKAYTDLLTKAKSKTELIA